MAAPTIATDPSICGARQYWPSHASCSGHGTCYTDATCICDSPWHGRGEFMNREGIDCNTHHHAIIALHSLGIIFALVLMYVSVRLVYRRYQQIKKDTVRVISVGNGNAAQPPRSQGTTATMATTASAPAPATAAGTAPLTTVTATTPTTGSVPIPVIASLKEPTRGQLWASVSEDSPASYAMHCISYCLFVLAYHLQRALIDKSELYHHWGVCIMAAAASGSFWWAASRFIQIMTESSTLALTTKGGATAAEAELKYMKYAIWFARFVASVGGYLLIGVRLQTDTRKQTAWASAYLVSSGVCGVWIMCATSYYMRKVVRVIRELRDPKLDKPAKRLERAANLVGATSVGLLGIFACAAWPWLLSQGSWIQPLLWITASTSAASAVLLFTSSSSLSSKTALGLEDHVMGGDGSRGGGGSNNSPKNTAITPRSGTGGNGAGNGTGRGKTSPHYSSRALLANSSRMAAATAAANGAGGDNGSSTNLARKVTPLSPGSPGRRASLGVGGTRHNSQRDVAASSHHQLVSLPGTPASIDDSRVLSPSGGMVIGSGNGHAHTGGHHSSTTNGGISGAAPTSVTSVTPTSGMRHQPYLIATSISPQPHTPGVQLNHHHQHNNPSPSPPLPRQPSFQPLLVTPPSSILDTSMDAPPASHTTTGDNSSSNNPNPTANDSNGHGSGITLVAPVSLRHTRSGSHNSTTSNANDVALTITTPASIVTTATAAAPGMEMSMAAAASSSSLLTVDSKKDAAKKRRRTATGGIMVTAAMMGTSAMIASSVIGSLAGVHSRATAAVDDVDDTTTTTIAADVTHTLLPRVSETAATVTATAVADGDIV